MVHSVTYNLGLAVCRIIEEVVAEVAVIFPLQGLVLQEVLAWLEVFQNLIPKIEQHPFNEDVFVNDTIACFAEEISKLFILRLGKLADNL